MNIYKCSIYDINIIEALKQSDYSKGIQEEVCQYISDMKKELEFEKSKHKEVREYVENHTITNMEWWITGEQKIECKFMKDSNPQELLEILDKENK